MISIENFDLSNNNLKNRKTCSNKNVSCFMDANSLNKSKSSNVDRTTMGLLKIGSESLNGGSGVGGGFHHVSSPGSGAGTGGSGHQHYENGVRSHSRQQYAHKAANQYKPVILVKARENGGDPKPSPPAVNRNSTSSDEKSQQPNGLAPRAAAQSQPSIVLAAKPASFSPTSGPDVVKNMSRSFAGPVSSQPTPAAPVNSVLLSAAGSPQAQSISAKLQPQKDLPKPTVATAVSVAGAAQPQVASVPLTPEVISARLSTAPFMAAPVRLLDENMIWQDGLQEFLLDQPDFLVVGVLGKERTGKSTLMSYLAGGRPLDAKAELVFNRQTSTTSGVQAFVTSERTILLDVQPLLSSSVLDKAIAQDKKHITNDYKFHENYIELQSIELACFILSVCNVVLLTEDWFTDPNLFRLIKTAEMLTPAYPGAPLNPPAPSSADLDFNFHEHRPHLVYVLNKCGYTNSNELHEMKEAVHAMTKGSKLIHRGSLNAGTSAHLGRHIRSRKGPRPLALEDKENVNMLVIPRNDGQATSSGVENLLVNFAGMPSFERSVSAFANQILSIKRASSSTAASSQQAPGSSNLFGASFTEKKWFAFAAKMWDLIRKSTSINEYNRLMT